jgi:hypothetical protein
MGISFSLRDRAGTEGAEEAEEAEERGGSVAAVDVKEGEGTTLETVEASGEAGASGGSVFRIMLFSSAFESLEGKTRIRVTLWSSRSPSLSSSEVGEGLDIMKEEVGRKKKTARAVGERNGGSREL